MSFSILVQNPLGVPPPYNIILCDPGPLNCITVATNVTLPYTIAPVPAQFSGAGQYIFVYIESTDPNYSGSCEPSSIVNPYPPLTVNCQIFLVQLGGNSPNVWSYDFLTNNCTFLMGNFIGQLPQGIGLDIANDANFIYVLTAELSPTTYRIYKYQYTSSPFSATYVSTLPLGSTTVDSGLELANGILISARGNNIISINPNSGLVQVLFPKPANRLVHGDILYAQSSSGPKLFCLYKDTTTNDMYITQHNYSNGVVDISIKIYDVATSTGISDPYGLFMFSNNLYIVGDTFVVYNIDKNPPYTVTPINNTLIGVAGTSNDSTCNNFEFILVPPPLPSPSPTPTKSPTPTPTPTPTKTPTPTPSSNPVVLLSCQNGPWYGLPWQDGQTLDVKGISVTAQIDNQYSNQVRYVSNNVFASQIPPFQVAPFTCPSIGGQPPIESVWLGAYSTGFDYNLIFGQPVNNVVIVLDASGVIGGSANETFIFSANTGIPTITNLGSCYASVSGNQIDVGAGCLNSSNCGGGKFRITTSTNFTHLKISGPGGELGSHVYICLENPGYVPPPSSTPPPTPTPSPSCYVVNPVVNSTIASITPINQIRSVNLIDLSTFQAINFGSSGTEVFDYNFNIVGWGSNTVLTNNGIWRNNNGLTGPYYRTGVWTPDQTGTVQNVVLPLLKYIGFTFCYTAISTTEICIGIGSTQHFAIRINGRTIVNSKMGYPFLNTTYYWHVYPVILQSGSYVIEMLGLLESSDYGLFGCEIYQNTRSQVISASNLGSLNIIFSSANKRGSLPPNNTNPQYFDVVYNYGRDVYYVLSQSILNGWEKIENFYISDPSTLGNYCPPPYLYASCSQNCVSFTQISC